MTSSNGNFFFQLNIGDADDMGRQLAYYDVSVMRDLLWYASNIVDNESFKCDRARCIFKIS